MAGGGSTSSSSAIVRFHYSTLDAVLTAWEAAALWRDWEGHLGCADPDRCVLQRARGGLGGHRGGRVGGGGAGGGGVVAHGRGDRGLDLLRLVAAAGGSGGEAGGAEDEDAGDGADDDQTAAGVVAHDDGSSCTNSGDTPQRARRFWWRGFFGCFFDKHPDVQRNQGRCVVVRSRDADEPRTRQGTCGRGAGRIVEWISRAARSRWGPCRPRDALRCATSWCRR